MAFFNGEPTISPAERWKKENPSSANYFVPNRDTKAPIKQDAIYNKVAGDMWNAQNTATKAPDNTNGATDYSVLGNIGGLTNTPNIPTVTGTQNVAKTTPATIPTVTPSDFEYTPNANVLDWQNKLSAFDANAPEAYSPSQATLDAAERLSGYNSTQPAPYTSSYQQQLDGLMGQILNNEKFSYDFNADPLYQVYKDQYTANGKTAMNDTISKAAQMSGGFGNSYATTAGNQAYNGYMQELNSVIPELEQAAYDKYLNENSERYNQLSALQSADNDAYGKYRDTVGDWQTNRDYATDRADTEYSKDYGQYRDSVGDWESNRNFTADRYDTEYNKGYQEAADKLTQDNYQNEFAYNQARDALAQQNYQNEFDYNRAQDERSQQNIDREFAYNQSQDAINNMLKASSGTSETAGTGMSFSDITKELDGYVEKGGSAAWDYLGRQGAIDEDTFNTLVAMYGLTDPDASTAVDYSVYDIDNPYQSNYPRAYLDPNGRTYFK